MKRTTRRGERGQVLVIAALLMTVLLGMLALLIDVGNAYAQRRFMQNAADAASVAGARQLATSMQSGTSDAAMQGTIDGLLDSNGHAQAAGGGSPSAVWYIRSDGSRVRAIGTGNVPPVPLGGAPTITGVEVQAGKNVDTFFARVFGVRQLTVRASATATYGNASSLELTPPTGTRVLPIIFSLQTYNQSLATCGGYDGYLLTFALGITDPFTCNGNTGDGGFNWGPIAPGNNSNAIVKDLLDPGASVPGAQISVGDPVQTSPGERAVDYRDLDANWQGQDVIVPLLLNTDGCPNCSPPLAAFAWFHVYHADSHGNPKVIQGWWVDPRTKPPLPGRLVGGSSQITGPVSFVLSR